MLLAHRRGRRAAAAFTLVASLSVAPARAQDGGGPLDKAAADRAAAAKALVLGVGAALEGDAAAAGAELKRAIALAPDVADLGDVAGLSALLLGDSLSARAALVGRPGLELWAAMAQADGPGGLSRARELLAHEARAAADPDPGVLFLAALAFQAEGERAEADALLARAVRAARGPLDEAFAPDPAVGLVSAALRASRVLAPGDTPALAFGAKLLESGRRPQAVKLAEAVLSGREPGSRGAARRLMMHALEASEPRRALEQAEQLLREEPGDDEATVTRIELLITLHDLSGARRALEAAPTPAGETQARFFRAKAYLLLEGHGDARAALEAAERAATADPRSSEGRAILCRALLATGATDRALAFANELIGRQPKDVDPFAVLQEIDEARGDRARAQALHLESEAFRSDQARVRREVERRERVIRAVRDAATGLGTVGLDALRGEDPFLALPIDLALVRWGKKGTQHAARDRVLAACAPELARFLRARKSWSMLSVPVSPYGKAESVAASLSAADPGRCAHPPTGTGRRRPPR